MKGYKGFKKDLTCRGFKFEVGETYEIKGELKICKNGFHFCEKLNDINEFYTLGQNTVICEIEALGEIQKESTKYCTDKIKIIRQLTEEEVLSISNTGYRNTGYSNTGNWNTGNRNTGDWNTGNWNTGDSNTGDSNTGDSNTGYRNTGNWNTGNCNTGDSNTGNWNTGNWNTGDSNAGNRNTGDSNTGNWNTGDWNSSNNNNGFFNSIEVPCYIFNQNTNMTVTEFKNSKYYSALNSEFLMLTEWIYYTEEEKQESKEKELIGGYLKKHDYKEACNVWWNKLTEYNKKIIQQIPNFNKDIFFEITGIKIEG